MWVSRIPGKSRAPAKFCSSDWHIMYVYIHLHTQSRTHGLLPQSTNKPLAASRTEGWARQEEEWRGGGVELTLMNQGQLTSRQNLAFKLRGTQQVKVRRSLCVTVPHQSRRQ